MKTLFSLISTVIVSSSLFAQNTITERREYTENGVTKSWTITKELDAEGNIIRYDSSYFERDANQNNPPGSEEVPNGNYFQWNFDDSLGTNDGQHFNFFFSPETGMQFDTTFWSPRFDAEFYQNGEAIDPEELMKRHREMMEQFFKDFNQDDFFIKPEDREEKLPKGKRI